MAQVQKFLFDRSFDERRPTPDRRKPDQRDGANAAVEAADPQSEADITPDGAAAAEAAGGYSGLDRRRRGAEADDEPPPEMYSAAQLEAAREEGYIKGHTAALEEAAKTDSHVSAEALRTIAQAIDGLDDSRAAHERALERQAVRLALSITRRLLPAMGEAVAAKEIESLVSRALGDLMDQPRLFVRVNGAVADTMRSALRDLQVTSGYEGRVVVRPDNTMAQGDCRLEWGEGGIERDTDRLWAEVEAAVGRHLEEAIPPAPMAGEGNDTGKDEGESGDEQKAGGESADAPEAAGSLPPSESSDPPDVEQAAPAAG
jgi:flagellar assembly protein FliH